MLSNRILSKRVSFLIISTMYVLALSSCSSTNNELTNTTNNCIAIATEPYDVEYGIYRPVSIDCNVYLELTEDTIMLNGDTDELNSFWEYICSTGNIPDNERKRLFAKLTTEWSKERKYIIQPIGNWTAIMWEWTENKSMISGGHFEDETHLEFYSVIFEYSNEE